MYRTAHHCSVLVLAIGVLISLSVRPASSQSLHRKQLADKLQSDLQRVANAAIGVVGVAVVDITTGQRFGVNEEWVFPQGSAIKIPILIELFRRADRGDLRLSDRVSIRAADRVGGSG